MSAVSAWNDNGQRGSVRDHQQLYRSDFFPGLGWMLPRRVWVELQPKWPAAYWDDWLREPAQRQGRHVIRPEVSRTLHIGREGVSNSEFDSVSACACACACASVLYIRVLYSYVYM
jgi:alpha-1,3-mannosyl-glycoprotein beta-1,2-N-acetylglucosaminyltransferase